MNKAYRKPTTTDTGIPASSDKHQLTAEPGYPVPGTKSGTLLDFSSMPGVRGSLDTWRDPRGIIVKFYTSEGNYDLARNSAPMFFIRDPILQGNIVMQIQINTDKNISGHMGLAQSIKDVLRRALSRSSDQIIHIEVHLSDDNYATKSTMTSKHCLLEVRYDGRQPITASAQAQTAKHAAIDAAKKMVDLLETKLDNC